jgi:histidinol-phosphatase (PHP family)
MIFDYHLHTPLCQHAKGHPREYVLAAQKAGLSEIGFSDHNPMPTQFDSWRMAPDQLPEYLKLIDEARTEFPDFPVRLGLECDYIAGYEDHIRMLAKAAEWDYFIGSVHYLILPLPPSSLISANQQEPWPMDSDSPRHLKKWSEYPVEEIWQRYFDEYGRMAASGLFDFLAHPDLVKKLATPSRTITALLKSARPACANRRAKFIRAGNSSKWRSSGIFPFLSIPILISRKKWVMNLSRRDNWQKKLVI